MHAPKTSRSCSDVARCQRRRIHPVLGERCEVPSQEADKLVDDGGIPPEGCHGCRSEASVADFLKISRPAELDLKSFNRPEAEMVRSCVESRGGDFNPRRQASVDRRPRVKARCFAH